MHAKFILKKLYQIISRFCHFRVKDCAKMIMKPNMSNSAQTDRSGRFTQRYTEKFKGGGMGIDGNWGSKEREMQRRWGKGEEVRMEMNKKEEKVCQRK